jgi:hypothetical protein
MKDLGLRLLLFLLLIWHSLISSDNPRDTVTPSEFVIQFLKKSTSDGKSSDTWRELIQKNDCTIETNLTITLPASLMNDFSLFLPLYTAPDLYDIIGQLDELLLEETIRGRFTIAVAGKIVTITSVIEDEEFRQRTEKDLCKIESDSSSDMYTMSDTLFTRYHHKGDRLREYLRVTSKTVMPLPVFLEKIQK